MVCAILLIIPIFLNEDVVLGWVGRDNENLKLALEYSLLMTASIFMMGTFDLFKKFFISMGLAIAPLIIQIAGLLIQCGMNYLLVQHLQLKGIAVSLIISSSFMSFCAIIYLFSLRTLKARNYLTWSFLKQVFHF